MKKSLNKHESTKTNGTGTPVLEEKGAQRVCSNEPHVSSKQYRYIPTAGHMSPLLDA